MASTLVNNLPAYVQAERLPLIAKAALGAKTVSMIAHQSGVKGKANLNLIDTAPAFIDGSACGWSAQASGGATLSYRTLETKPIGVNMEFCHKALLGKAFESEVRIAAGEERLPFEQEFTQNIAERISEKVEKMVWQGVDLNGDNTLDLKGFVDCAIDASAPSVTISAGTTVYDAIKSVILAIPTAVLDKAVVFVGADTYRSLAMELVAKNYYHYAGPDGAMELIFPGTNTKIVAVNGLNANSGFKSGHKYAFAADPDNMFYGYDIENAEDAFDIWFSKDDQIFKLNVLFNAGVQIAYPSEVVYADLG